MAVTYDNDAEGVATNATSITLSSFTVGNNANRAMVVNVATWDGTVGASAVSGVTWNGSATGWAVINTETGPGAAIDRATQWGLTAPAVATANVVISFGGTCDEIGANVLSVYDADQATTFANAIDAEGITNDPSVTVTSAVGDMVVDAVYFSGSGIGAGSVGAGQTSRMNSLIVSTTRALSSTEPGAATVTMSWNVTGTGTEWVTTACTIRVAAAAAGIAIPVLTRQYRQRWS